MDKYLDSVVDKYAREAEYFIVNTWDGYSNFTLNIKKDYSKTRSCSRGGLYASGPGINIAMVFFTRPTLSIYRFYEYKSYDNDKIIGGFFSNDQEHRIAAITLHEVAHAAQFYGVANGLVNRDTPHGLSFKKPYKLLRKQFLNHKIPINQYKLKLEYEKIINRINNGLSVA